VEYRPCRARWRGSGGCGILAVRFKAMYENSDTFRDYGHPERYGFNPTVTLKPRTTTPRSN
jgi:hypothetical protein